VRSLVWVSIIALPIELWMVSIGGRPRLPYFMALLPIFAIFSGFSIWVIFDSLLRDIPKIAGAALALLMVVSLGWTVVADFIEINVSNGNQNGDRELISYIEQNTGTQDTVLMWGAETSYNFITRRHSPTRFMYQTAFYNGFADKNELIQFLTDILKYRPRLIVLAREDKLSDFRFVNRDNQVGMLMDEVKVRYSSRITINNWQIFSDPSQ
jgi:hypothetical protein